MSSARSWSELSGADEALAALHAYELGQECEAQLLAYCLALQKYDEHTNLVANSDLTVLLKEHVLDSLTLLEWIEKSNKVQGASLIDIGSGAGFPGMVLAITAPHLKVTLVDSIGKKCRFLESAVDELGLSKRVQVKCDRAEALAHVKKFREHFDFATARAVGALPLVCELCIPMLKSGGRLLAQRSKRQAQEENQLADAYASRLGGELDETRHFEPDLLGREFALLVFRKKKTTPACYPRSAALMKKDPRA